MCVVLGNAGIFGDLGMRKEKPELELRLPPVRSPNLLCKSEDDDVS